VRNILCIIAGLFLMSAAPALADKQEIDKVMGQVIDQCATITGAHYVNQRCKHLPDQVEAQFAKEPEYCRTQIEKLMGPNAQFWQKLDAAAKSTADSKECGDETKKIAIQGFNMSVKLHDALSMAVNGPDTKDLINPPKAAKN